VTNGAAIGYMILAAHRMGLTGDLLEKFERAMLQAMDQHTEQYAEEVYRNT
jgi:hypothetical protein